MSTSTWRAFAAWIASKITEAESAPVCWAPSTLADAHPGASPSRAMHSNACRSAGLARLYRRFNRSDEEDEQLALLREIVGELAEGEILRRILARLGEASTALVGPGDDAAVIAADQATSETLVDKWARDWAATLRTLSPSGASVSAEDAGVIGAAVVGIIHEGSAYAHRHGNHPGGAIDLLTRLIVKALS